MYGAAYLGGGTEALSCLLLGEPWNWAEVLVSGGVWAFAMLLVAGAQRRGWFPLRGDREGRTLLRTALATGELPPDARHHAWETLLEAEIRELGQSRWVTVALALTLSGLVLAAAVVNEDRGISAFAIALSGFVSLPFRLLTLRKRRAEALLARVLAG
jgi:hypothetical protein